jgi:hypothetical protein
MSEPLVLINASGDRALVDPIDFHGADARLNAAMWLAKGFAPEVAKQDPPADKPTFADLVPEPWRDAFAKAGLDTVEAIAAATVDALDAIDVKGLGPATAAKLIEAAKAALA